MQKKVEGRLRITKKTGLPGPPLQADPGDRLIIVMSIPLKNQNNALQASVIQSVSVSLE